MAGMRKYVTKASVRTQERTAGQKARHDAPPPPALPKPPVKELAVPTTFLSKNPVDQTWQGTKLPPSMPTKKRRARRPLALVTAPAKTVGIEPASKQPAKTYRGLASSQPVYMKQYMQYDNHPKRSQRGPATNRTRSLYQSVKNDDQERAERPYVAVRAMIFELAMSVCLSFKSFAIVTVNYNRVRCRPI